MQTKKYPIPSARARTQIRRNILNTLEKHENADWLNDVHPASPIATTQTHEHTVCYEDLPTMPLSILNPSLAIQTSGAMHEEELIDEDKTIQLNKRKKNSINNPLDALLRDETISGITALGPQRIYVERNGAIQQTSLRFSDEPHMMRVIEQLLHNAGQSMPIQSPLTNVRLPDDSLLTVALPPSALNGPALTLRKCTKHMSTLYDLVKQGSLNQKMADVLSACVQARLNIWICGPVGSGRTTLLNALCAAIPKDERIVTIEDAAELQLSQSQVVALQASTKAHTTISDLVSHAERMHVNHVIVGECRGNEAERLLQSMYNGLNGVMTTMYAQNVRDCLTRFETLCLLASKEQSSPRLALIRTQIAQSIHIVVSLSAEHKVTNIAEIQLLDEGPVKIQSLFHYQESNCIGVKNPEDAFKASGFQPAFLERCKTLGINIPNEVFVI